MLRKVLAFLVLCAAFSGQGAIAAPVVYDEGVSGDLSSTSPRTFAFDVGANTVSGVSRFITSCDSLGRNCTFDFDTDPFFFSFVAGLQVTSVNLQSTFTPVSESGAGQALVWSLLNPYGVSIAPTCQLLVGGTDMCRELTDIIPATGGSLYSGAMPLTMPFEGGLFAIRTGSLSSASVGTATGGYLAYTLTFDVRAMSVPEPSTLALLGLSLAGLAVARRRKH